MLADKIGVTFQQVQKYEKGTNRISSSRLFEIATALNKPISYFFAEFHVSEKEARLIDKVNTGEVKEGLRLIKAFFEIDRPVLRRKAISLLESFAEPRSKSR
jgi:transcriptional regulator with XRE-family HTH domain